MRGRRWVIIITAERPIVNYSRSDNIFPCGCSKSRRVRSSLSFTCSWKWRSLAVSWSMWELTCVSYIMRNVYGSYCNVNFLFFNVNIVIFYITKKDIEYMSLSAHLFFMIPTKKSYKDYNIFSIFFKSNWAWLDLNQWPIGYEPTALTNWATGPQKRLQKLADCWIWTCNPPLTRR